MEWKYVKKLMSADLIADFESTAGYCFCDAFRNCVLLNNGGRPSKRCFDTDKAKGREIKSLLSFNKEDRETVWKIFEWSKTELANQFIPFAIDNFGNLICFDNINSKVVFLNHEDQSTECIADNFETFINELYD